MAKLKNTKVLRKPSTGGTSRWGRDDRAGWAVKLDTRYSDTDERELRFSFDMSAPGFDGMTNVRLLIEIDDYSEILRAMCDVDRDAALSAMADELAKQLKAT